MKVFCLSLGCAKNMADSECLAGELRRAGHELVADAEAAEVGIINTCGFIRPAVEESIEEILALEELKKEGVLKKIGVVGCLFNRYGVELSKWLPSVDFWAKCEDWNAVLKALGNASSEGGCRAMLPSSSKYTRYLKIAEGCDNRCSYCAIPSIRGPLRSRTISALVEESELLVEEGAREICVVGQDLTVYGADFGRFMLPDLLDALEGSLPETVRLRLLYLHPRRVTAKLLERVASGTNVMPYLDIPIQHADPKILAAMNRAMSWDDMLEVFKTARKIRPDFALRTTCMVGFPGEKKKHFDNLMKFIDTVRFDRMGAFVFFPEEGTPAYGMTDQIPEAVKKRRFDALMTAQEEISYSRQQLFVGMTFDVLVERVEPEYGFAEGRSYREAPEVDGLIEIRNIRPGLKEGDVIRVKMLEAMPYDMIGEEE